MSQPKYTICISELMDSEYRTYSFETYGNTYEECLYNAVYIYHNPSGENTWSERFADDDEAAELILLEITKHSILLKIL